MGLREVWLCGDCAAEFHQEYLALECCAPEPELRSGAGTAVRVP